MTDAEKIAAFNDLADAMTNQYWDGRWAWWCPTMAGGVETMRATMEEAVADLVAWAKRKAPKQRNRRK